MFHHLVFWKFREGAKAELPDAVERLRSLAHVVPVIRALHAGTDQVHSPRSWDLGLVVTLDSPADLDAYDRHPAHQAVRDWIRERAEASASVDFED